MALEQFQNNELPEEAPAQVPEAPKQATREKAFADDATIRLQQKRLEYDAHLQNLIDVCIYFRVHIYKVIINN